MKLRLPAPGVFAAVTLLILCGGLAFTVWWPYHREQAVIEYLESVGTVDVDYEYRGPGILEPYADSEWLNWFRRIAQLRIDQSAGGVADVPSLAPLRRCYDVTLIGCQVDRKTLQRVAACPALWTLGLERCQLNAGALHGLEGHARLRDIEMVMTRLLDSDVLELPAAPRLVSFRGNFNWDMRVLDVSAVPDLLRVEVKNCGFDDEGAARLLEAPGLRVLRMPNTGITDAAIDEVLQMESLRFLDLRLDRRLSPEQIERLAELPRLRTAAVWYAVTDEEFDELQKVLPQATLDRRP